MNITRTKTKLILEQIVNTSEIPNAYEQSFAKRERASKQKNQQKIRSEVFEFFFFFITILMALYLFVFDASIRFTSYRIKQSTNKYDQMLNSDLLSSVFLCRLYFDSLWCRWIFVKTQPTKYQSMRRDDT